jgi:uncharacterized protein (TIGR03437 family)
LASAAQISALAQASSLVPSTSQLTLDAIANGPLPLSQIFTVAGADGSFVNIETLVDGGSAGTPAPSWITVTPQLATTPAQVEVAANAAGLSPGAYSARIQFTDVKGDSLGSPVTVTLQVTSLVTTGLAQLAISPPILNLSGSVEQTSVQAGIFLRNLGPGTLAPVSVSVVSGYPWLSAVVPPCDTVCAISVSAAIATLPPGPLSGLLRVSTALGSTDVPVALFANNHGPVVQVAPEGLQFDTVENTGLVDSRTMSLLNTGDGPAKWAAGVVAGGAWLSVNPPSGVASPGSVTQLTASMNSGFMGPGEYGGLISISAQDGSFNPLYVPVVLRIETGDTAPVPLLSVGGTVFQAQADQTQQLPVTLSAGSAGLINFEVSAQTASWLSAGPMQGQVSGTTPVQLTMVGAPIALQPGFYSGLVNVAFGAGALRSLNVGISVVDPAATNCKPQFLYLTETALPDNFATRIGFPTPLEAVLVDNCGNYISNGLVSASFSNGDPDLVLQPLGQGQYAATWMPGSASSSLPNGVATVVLRGFVPALTIASSEVIGTIASDTAPSLNANAVLNNLNPQPGSPVAPGTIVQIYGSALSTAGTVGTGSVVNGLLSTTLNGVSVSVGGIAAPLFYGSSGQINAQIPNELQAGQQYELLVNVNGFYSNPVTITTTAAQPGLASFADGTVIAQDTNYNLITADNPAHAGEVIILYATGMGATNPPVATGTPAPSSPPAQVAIAPQVSIGGTNAQVLFAGLSPGSVGLYQIDVEIPAGAGTGNVPLVMTQNGVASNTVSLPVE